MTSPVESAPPDLPLRDDPPGDRAGAAAPAPAPVAVIILQWGRSDETQRCLAALDRTRGATPRAVVVDNGSPSPVDREAIRHRPGIRLVENGNNLGFAAGNNRILRELLDARRGGEGPSSVLLLNNDVEVEPLAIAEMVSVMEETGAAAVGALNRVRGAKTLTSSGGFVRWPSGRYRDAGAAAAASGFRAFDVDAVCGSTMLLDLAALERVGLFDEKYFCVYEETDLCLRLREAGHRVVLAPRALVDHAVGASTGRRLHFYFRFRNRVRLVRAHRGRRGLALMVPGYLLEAAARSCAYLVLGRADDAGGVIRGVRDGLRGIGGPPGLR